MTPNHRDNPYAPNDLELPKNELGISAIKIQKNPL